MKATFISWAPYHRRTELLGEQLGTTVHFIHYGRSGKAFQAPIRYAMQAVKTWRILSRERTDVVLVQNPPIFAVLLGHLYAQRHGARYIIDSHSGAFVSRKWRWALGLHRLLSQAALTTIVHNKAQGKVVEFWGCPYSVVPDPIVDYPPGERFPLSEQFNVAVVCSYVDGDEPLAVVLEAAQRLPNASFYMTGDSSRVSPPMLDKKPHNCYFTGYLPYDQYIGLLRGVDAIMVLTGFHKTLLCGGFEATSIGKPLITSDWPILKEYYSLGAVHVPNTVEGVVEGVRRAQTEYDTLQRDILRLRARLEYEWSHNLQKLQDLLRG